jgi:diguanylate cyclase (GGDEF)-like protein
MPDQPEPFLIFNEEQFRHLLGREVQRATRYQDFLSLCLARADSPGALSPSVLAAVARRMAELLRATDVVGLIDDVIAILLVHTADSDAATIVERLRGRLEAETFEAAPGAPAVKPVLSLGLASFPTDATADATLVARAQTRLSEAGRSGQRASEIS